MIFENDDYLKFISPTPKEAITVQKELAQKVILKDEVGDVNYVAGVDVSCELFKPALAHHAAVVILSFPELEVVEQVSYSALVDFPYIPGLLAFREVPLIVKALEKVKTKSDVILVDGHGISHPRKLGIASHLGVLTNYATIGCAKSILVGEPCGVLQSEKGSFVPLKYKGETVGRVLRTKNNVSPIYVSIGHKISLEKACGIVLNCTTKYKLPEPIRAAHKYANQVRREYGV